MDMADFVEARRPRWQSLEGLLSKAEGHGLRALALEEAQQLSRLYRGASSDLLWVRARAGSAEVSGYLNDLVGRAYALTYPGRRFRFSEVRHFLWPGFPILLRRHVRALGAAVLLTTAGAAFGYLGMALDPSAAAYLVPEEHQDIDPVRRAEGASAGPVAATDEQAAFASFLFTHNIQVAFLCFALGVTLGVGTAVLLFINGLMLGALAQVYAAKEMAGWFWAWILPHGIPELTAICIAGAAGFVLAQGWVDPGALSRRQALRRQAGEAVRILFGTLALFVLAGCIEGTISQIHPPHLSVAFKIGFALVVGAGVYGYLFSAYLRPSWKPS